MHTYVYVYVYVCTCTYLHIYIHYTGIEVGVIEGIEKALEKMKVEEESEVIIKPQYAFGKDGNPSLNVPPSTEVTYIVKFISFAKVRFEQIDRWIDEWTNG